MTCVCSASDKTATVQPLCYWWEAPCRRQLQPHSQVQSPSQRLAVATPQEWRQRQICRHACLFQHLRSPCCQRADLPVSIVFCLLSVLPW